MFYKIWLDKEGQEIKRETKGRGRIAKGFVKRDDGNWYIQDECVIEQKKISPPAITETVVVVEPPKKTLRKMTRNATKQIQASTLQKVCLSINVEEKDGVFSLYSTIPLISGLEEYGLEFNSVYERVELDTRLGQIRIFSIKAPAGPPVLIVNNALVIEY